KYLAPAECDTALLCGCGGQAAAQLRALLCVRRPLRIVAFDQEAGKAAKFATAIGKELGMQVDVAQSLADAVGQSRIVITCTTSRRFFVTKEMVRPGTFIAAVGADREDKQEIEPRLLAAAKLVTDLTDQACAIGDLHHAIAAGAMTREAVHAQLGEVICGRKPGRESEDEITVFDSTGTGIQDVAAAIAVYSAAIEENTCHS